LSSTSCIKTSGCDTIAIGFLVMPYQFSCPQGHILQGELSTVGQIMRCPVCGGDFHVPPPNCGTIISEESSALHDAPHFNLGFDPLAKASLPFDLPGHTDLEGNGNSPEASPPPLPSPFLTGPAPVSPMPATAFSPPSLSPTSTFPATPFPNTEIKLATAMPSVSADDFLAGPAAASEPPAETAPPPKMLHIRCPSGHMVKAPSDLLGKLGRCPACKKTFELRYENSLEFKRRTENILRRDENEANRAWIGWTFVAVFLVFVALVGAVLMLGR
jgi:hypothetical protein